MNTIQTIRVGACAFAAACALGACTQPTGGTYGTRAAPPAPPDGRGAQSTTTMPDANTRYDTRPSPGNTMPKDANVGEPADMPPPGPNGAQGDPPLPGTPPPMQY
ncbi:hypothetical protein [Burkholderia cenocepacia]|uniref:hypothetical protein n=1 Tax=Burkholderia cenocepacia TaxID=95486 RepID=UPI0008476ED5|nr:hypothetical protein [Burkholderia cenocepacia]MDR8103595.1 hypothetical protein [Burkholderia cenocepacia]CAB5103625.1 hypothetical protein IST4113_06329 [Burkholderia cenocepacia]CAB5157887.1 hypothetical protein IST4134_06331 [Burkholderia cenocepacia]CAB5161672.1 hypothetical protein IST4112_06316 [Burkholderia cenocepacia]CAB5164333.1 hypothetical protein IST4131_06172 [Burkholderia cenocepacia]